MTTLILTTEFPPYKGGIGSYCKEMFDAAISNGLDFEVLAPNYHQTHIENNRISRYQGGVFNPKQFPTIVSAINRQISLKSYKVIHVADWPMLLALHWSKINKNIPIIVTFHGTDAIILSKAKTARLLGAKFALKRVTRICANSNYTMSLVEKLLPITNRCEKIVTPLGVGTDWFNLATEEQITVVKNLVNAKAGDKILLTVARLDKRKGHDNAIKAIGLIDIELRKKVKYLIIGAEVDAGYLVKLKALARENDVNCYFVGEQQHDIVKGAYGAASLFLLPARNDEERVEGFGLVFLEASAQGLPSLAFGVHGIPEVIKNNINGWCCESGDLYKIKEMIVDTLAMSQSQVDLNKKQCIKFAQKFSWKKCMNLTYENIVIN